MQKIGRREKKVNRMEPSHPARQISPQVATTAEERTVKMVLEKYIYTVW